MKKLSILSLFLIIQVACIYSQNKGIVNASELNVRENPGKQNKVVGLLKSGDTVDYKPVNEEWTEIKSQTGIQGFVMIKYLSEIKDQNGNQKEDVDEDFNSGYNIFAALIFIVIMYYVIKFLYFSKPQKNSNGTTTAALYWYYCTKCKTLVRQSKKPSGINCIREYHSWVNLGEVGDTNYRCNKCGMTLYTKNKPNSLHCDAFAYHFWTKL